MVKICDRFTKEAIRKIKAISIVTAKTGKEVTGTLCENDAGMIDLEEVWSGTTGKVIPSTWCPSGGVPVGDYHTHPNRILSPSLDDVKFTIEQYHIDDYAYMCIGAPLEPRLVGHGINTAVETFICIRCYKIPIHYTILKKKKEEYENAVKECRKEYEKAFERMKKKQISDIDLIHYEEIQCIRRWEKKILREKAKEIYDEIDNNSKRYLECEMVLLDKESVNDNGENFHANRKRGKIYYPKLIENRR